jgi:hypothetical protein
MTTQKTPLEEMREFREMVQKMGTGELGQQPKEFQEAFLQKRRRQEEIEQAAWKEVATREGKGFTALENQHLKEGISQLETRGKNAFYALMCSKEQAVDPELKKAEWIIRWSRTNAIIALERYNGALQAMPQHYATGNIAARCAGWALTCYLLLALFFEAWLFARSTICYLSLLCGIASHLIDSSVHWGSYYGTSVGINADPVKGAKWAYCRCAGRPISLKPLLDSNSTVAERVYELNLSQMKLQGELTGHIINELFALNSINASK